MFGEVRPRRSEAGFDGFVTRLLIADDSALMRKLLEGIFRAEGDFEIRLARNGAEALELVRSFDPQVVTLDVQMPGMDGLACLGQIMIEAPRPVVMISALTEEGAEATLEAIELGAVDFVAKPGGAVSLEIDRLRPLLVEKVRGAASARIRPTLRLRERIRYQFRRRRRAAARTAAAQAH
jgi:two-component system chemotaxis response regulator CheB